MALIFMTGEIQNKAEEGGIPFREEQEQIREQQERIHTLEVRLADLRNRLGELEVINEALARNEGKYLNLINAAPSGIAIIQDERFVFVNPACQRITGYAEEEMTGKLFLELIVPEDRKMVSAKFQDRVGGRREPALYRFRILRRDGKIRDVELASNHIEHEGRSAAIGILHDVTESRFHEEQWQFQARLLDNVNDAIIATTHGPEFLITSWNHGAELIYGWTKEEVLGRPGTLFLQNEYIGQSREEALRDIIAHGSYRGEVIQSRRDGSRVFVDANLMSLRDPTGEIIGWVSLNRDITDRKKAEASLQRARDELEHRVKERTEELSRVIDELERATQDLSKTNELLEKIFATTHFAMVYLDRNFNYLRVNQTYANICGYDADYFPGKNHFELYPHRDSEGVFRRVAENGEPFTEYARPFEFPQYPGGGTAYWDWTIHPVKDGYGRVEGLLYVMLDVTPRVMAERALRESEMRFRGVFENGPLGIVLIDTNMLITEANETFSRMLGYEPREMVGIMIDDITHPDDREKDVQQARRLLSENIDALQWEKRYIKKNGEIFWVSVTATFVCDAKGGVLYGLGMTEDITERIRLERAVIEAGEGERRRIGQDLHDGLGQLLTGVSLFADSLEQRLLEAERPEARDAERIRKNVSRAIEHTRSLSRGLWPVEMEAVGFVAALQEMLSDFEKWANLNCSLVYPEHIPLPDDLTAVNLYYIALESLNNVARHATAENVNINLAIEEGQLRMSISDDGRGIEGNARDMRGLGLRIMNYRARIIGASLDIHSPPGGGTEVEVLLKL